jgi:hypothetical protein
MYLTDSYIIAIQICLAEKSRNLCRQIIICSHNERLCIYQSYIQTSAITFPTHHDNCARLGLCHQTLLLPWLTITGLAGQQFRAVSILAVWARLIPCTLIHVTNLTESWARCNTDAWVWIKYTPSLQPFHAYLEQDLTTMLVLEALVSRILVVLVERYYLLVLLTTTCKNYFCDK